MEPVVSNDSREVLVNAGEDDAPPQRSTTRRVGRVAGFTALAALGCAACFVGTRWVIMTIRHHHGHHGHHHHGDREFKEWMRENDKDYDSEHEYFMRKDIFYHNKYKVDHHNSHHTDGLLGAMQQDSLEKLNHFADLTGPEFSKIHASCFHGNMDRLGTSQGTFFYSGADLPESVDWRDTANPSGFSAVTPIKNQGQCGSCWSFSATGALEGHWAVKNNGLLVSMSEQELIDCSKKEGNMGCNGGLMDNAFQWEEGHRVCTEASYPYKGREMNCTADTTCEAAIPQGEVTGFVDIDHNDPRAMMEALTHGPVSVAIEADQRMFQFYHHGILTNDDPHHPKDPKHPKVCGTQLDHGVLCVGYGVEDGKGYWIVKNSWGPQWGDQGFIRFHRGLEHEKNIDGPGGMCGILMQASFPIFQGQDFSKNLKPADEPSDAGAGPYEAPPCQDGELNVHVQGIDGSYCAPKCDGSSCPAAPAGGSAIPQCVLQSPQGDKYCALVCTSQKTCPNGAECQKVQGDMGICTYADNAYPAFMLEVVGDEQTTISQ